MDASHTNRDLRDIKISGQNSSAVPHSDLEVVPPEEKITSPQLPANPQFPANPQYLANPHFPANPQLPEQYAYYADTPLEPPSSNRSWPSRKRLLVIFLVVGVVLIAVIVTVPVVLLNRSKQGTAGIPSESSPSPSGISISLDATPPSATSRPATSSRSRIPVQPTSTKTLRLDSIATLSPLAVATWPDDAKSNEDWKLRLVYQDDQGYLLATTYQTDSKKWISTTRRNTVKAKKGSPMGLMTFQREIFKLDPDGPQVDLMYFDDNNYLRQWHWLWGTVHEGRHGDLPQKLTGAPNSPLAAYWPYVYFQNTMNNLHQARYEPSTAGAYSWKNESFLSANLALDPPSSRSMAIIPTTQNLETVSVLHIDKNGDLMEWWRGFNGTAKYINNNPIVPSSSLSPTNHFTAFAIPALSSSTTALTSIILYQDPSNAQIYMLHRSQSLGSPWSKPITYPAFSDADKGTHIACITGLTWTNIKLESKKSGAAGGFNRCFFQVGGAVREVEMERKDNDDSVEGISWRIVGWVGFE